LAADDLAYVEEDLETLLLYAQAESTRSNTGRLPTRGCADRSDAELERARCEVTFTQGLQANGVPKPYGENREAGVPG